MLLRSLPLACRLLPRHCFSTLSRLPATSRHLLQAMSCPSRAQDIAVVDPARGRSYTYGELCSAGLQLAEAIKKNGKETKCIASYNKPGVNYVITALAAWHIGAALLPLCVAHTSPEISYFVTDSCSEVIVHEADGRAGVDHLNVSKICICDENIWSDDIQPFHSNITEFSNPNPSAHALILYTSGTSGAPKGCVHSHDSLSHMIASLVKAWEYSSDDKILHFLPLHHLHGVVNKLFCTLYAGGEVEFLASANPVEIWRRLAISTSDKASRSPTIFMAVPTVYARLLDAAEAARIKTDAKKDSQYSDEVQAGIHAIQGMRVNISGSAALPDPIMASWQELTGHVLLERYGMSEIGMALSNPLHGDRITGTVGQPLPFLNVRIVDENDSVITSCNESGELRIKGPTVFCFYYDKHQETKDAFDDEGWFKTGDIAIRERLPNCTNEVYRILGRASTDIIKSGGYKLSALEIERELLTHSQVAEAAVVGKADNTYGEVVIAVIVACPSTELGFTAKSSQKNDFIEIVKKFLKSRMAKYKQPKHYYVVPQIPRNLMGKVNKKTLLRDLYLTEEESN